MILVLSNARRSSVGDFKCRVRELLSPMVSFCNFGHFPEARVGDLGAIKMKTFKVL